MGKGSSARPFSISKEEYDNRFDNIFRKNRNANDETTTRQINSCGEADPGSSNTTPADSNKPCGTAENDTSTTTTN